MFLPNTVLTLGLSLNLIVDHILENSYESLLILCENKPIKQIDILFKLKLPVILFNQNEEFHFNKHDDTPVFQYPSRTPHQFSAKLNEVNKTFPILKFFMNHNFLTIIISSFSMEILTLLFNYQRSNRIFVVSENSTSLNLENFYDSKFSNVIFLDSDKIYSFDMFPVFKTNRLKNLFFKNHFKNIQKHKVILNFNPSRNHAILYKDRINRTIYGGFVFHCIKTLIQRINGDMVIKRNETRVVPGENGINFISGLASFVNKESISDSPFLIKWGIMMPYAREIDSALYLRAPMDNTSWICYFCYLFYTSALLSLATRDSDYFKHFAKVLRASLGQSFDYHTKRLPTIYILWIVFGFMITTWYSAFLGSFVTTVLREKQIDSWEDIHNENYKITLVDMEFERIKHIIWERDKNFDLYDVVTVAEFSRRSFALDNRYGYGIGSEYFLYFFNPLQKLFNIKKFIFLEKDYVVEHPFTVNFEENSIYKDVVNEFVHRAQSSGLFLHWLRYSFIEKRREARHLVYHPERIFRPIDINFLKYGFIILGLGYVAGFVSILWEIRRNFFKKCEHNSDNRKEFLKN